MRHPARTTPNQPSPSTHPVTNTMKQSLKLALSRNLMGFTVLIERLALALRGALRTA